MSNKIIVKHGEGKPKNGVLDVAELGWDTVNKILYIGTGNGPLNMPYPLPGTKADNTFYGNNWFTPEEGKSVAFFEKLPIFVYYDENGNTVESKLVHEKELETQIKELQTQITELQTQIEELQNQIVNS